MCISTTGYLQNCSWEKYYEFKKDIALGDYDGKERTIYVTLQDEAGHIKKGEQNYTVYNRCSNKTEWKEVSNTSNSCPKCGIANYTSYQENYDVYLKNKCDQNTVPTKCNIPSDCCSSVNYSTWSNWSTCSKTCGGGTQYRTRTATSKYNGQSCSGSNLVLTETQSCNTQSCDMNLQTEQAWFTYPIRYYNSFSGDAGSNQYEMHVNDENEHSNHAFIFTYDALDLSQFSKLTIKFRNRNYRSRGTTFNVYLYAEENYPISIRGTSWQAGGTSWYGCKTKIQEDNSGYCYYQFNYDVPKAASYLIYNKTDPTNDVIFSGATTIDLSAYKNTGKKYYLALDVTTVRPETTQGNSWYYFDTLSLHN